MFYLWYMVIIIPITIVLGFMIVMSSESVMFLMGLLIIVSIGVLVPTIALSARRLHDISISGWFQLLTFIPYIGGIVLLVLYCLPSKKGTNKYGPNPYGEIQPAEAPVAAPQTTPTGDLVGAE